MKKKGLVSFLFVVAIGVLVVSSLWAEEKAKGSPPVITASYAIERGYYGYVWKIYLAANDPDGDMARIAVEVDQVGYGHYPTDWIMLKGPYRKEFKGYLQWNTFSSRTGFLREWTTITVKVTVIDKAGNESRPVVFPFEFVSGAVKEPKLPSPFDSGPLPRLGYIHVDLFDPTQMGADNRREDY
ncbi:MAG: hypothetical protein N3G78_11280 [Desulfobacterota bacterium]|nr:hypothetical protein [Thermodesulfobacteriota bacterium]